MFNRKLIAGMLAAPAALAFASPALAQTAAGTTVTNDVTLSYSVGSVPQGDQTDSTDFVVDRAIDLAVVANSAQENLGAGTLIAPIAFTVTNTSNDTLDFAVAAQNLTGDDFDVSNIAVFVEADGAGAASPSFNPAVDTGTFIDELAPGTSIVVYLVGDDPGSLTDADLADVRLTATAREGGGASLLGAALVDDRDTGSGGDDTNQVNAMDTIFIDTGNDGEESDDSQYVFAAVNVTVNKAASIIWDPDNGADAVGNPAYAIPGAIVEYCISVINGSTDVLDNVTITDVVDTTNVNWLAADGTAPADETEQDFYVGGSDCAATTGGAQEDDGAVGSGDVGDFDVAGTDTMRAVFATVPASSTRTVRFRVEIR